MARQKPSGAPYSCPPGGTLAARPASARLRHPNTPFTGAAHMTSSHAAFPRTSAVGADSQDGGEAPAILRPAVAGKAQGNGVRGAGRAWRVSNQSSETRECDHNKCYRKIILL